MARKVARNGTLGVVTRVLKRTPMSQASSALFTPFSAGALALRNRIVMAPMTRNASPDGVPGANVAAYYRRRAEGGVGLILSEGTVVDHPAASGYAHVPHFYGEAALTGWRRVIEAVHAAGGKMFPQLWHVGAVRRPGVEPHPEVGGYGPSGLAKPGGRAVCHVMTESDIADVIDAFARAARDAQRLGFDGVELHGAHGYLIDQFFWEGVNLRDDAYGGSIEGRARFGAELVRAVRAAVGPEFPICLRFSQWKLQDYSARLARTPDELARFLAPLADAGVDLFHCSTRRYWLPEFEGSELNLAGWTKRLTGKPTITVGSIGLDTEFVSQQGGAGFNDARAASIDSLLGRLEAGEFDLAAVGRALIAEPNWPLLLQAGQLQDARGFSKGQLAELV
jgi:2,4-dienoyl-CoA reductase-like NADH-dependent reductase (Old Yellow Enzyme family)